MNNDPMSIIAEIAATVLIIWAGCEIIAVLNYVM
jgi:hypothetical protein